jgi:hypothetical protein
MLELVAENVDPIVVEDLGRAWTADKGFRKITERIAKALKDGKNVLVLYESIPLIFSQDILTPLVKYLQNEIPDLTILHEEVKDTTNFYEIMEEYLNNRGNLGFVLTCSKKTFDLIKNDHLGNVLISFFDTIDKVAGLVKLDDYLDYVRLTEQFPCGLNNENSDFVRENFDLPKLTFFTCLASLAMTLGIDLDDAVSLIKSLAYAEVGDTGILIPSARYLKNRKVYNIFVKTLNKRMTIPLDFLTHQSFLNVEDYNNILISMYLLKKFSREKIKDNFPALSVYYSPEYYSRIKKIAFNEFSAKARWFVFRLLFEAFISQGAPPEIKDYEIKYHLWPVYPTKNTTQEKEFQDEALEIVQRLSIKTSRSQFAQLSYDLLEGKMSYLLDPIFASPAALNENGLAQTEMKSLLASVSEIIEAIKRRWLPSEKATKQNGEALLKLQDLINIACILNFVYDSTVLKQQIPEFIDHFSSFVANIEGEHINLESLNLMAERTQLSEIFYHNEALLKAIEALQEAVQAYDLVREIDIQKIDKFLDIWSSSFQRDILSQRKGAEINTKLWKILGKKYHGLNVSLIDGYPQYMLQHKKQSGILNCVSDLLNQRRVVFLLIVDSFSFSDWFFVKKKLGNRFVVAEETPLCVGFPPETPVGHAAIFSSMDPLENGVFSRVIHTIDDERWEITQEANEGDSLSRVTGGDSQFKSELNKILASANTIKKCLVISPFEKTRLTTVLKCLITENAKWIENEFDWEKALFENVVDWICKTVCSRKKEELLEHGIIILLFPNLDERGHGGKKDWDATVYFAKLEEEIMRILNGIADMAREYKLQASIVITSDHGKMFHWETMRIEETLGKNFLNFSQARKEIIKACVKHVSKGRQPVSSAKYVLIWVDPSEKGELIGQIEQILNEKQGIMLIDEFEKMSGYSKNVKILPPDMAVGSMYSYVGPGLFQHSGLSMEELIIPYVRLDLNFNV